MLRRRCRLTCSSAGALLLHLLDPISVAGSARSAATPRRAARRPERADDRPAPHARATRASSTSRTMGLFRMSFLIAYSKASMVSPRQAATSLDGPQLRAARARIAPSSASLRRRSASSSAIARPRASAPAPRIVCFTMRSSSEWNVITTSRAIRRQTLGRLPHERVEPVELAVHPDPERLKRPRRRIDPLPAARWHAAPHDRGQFARSSATRPARHDRRARCGATAAPRRTGRSRRPAPSRSARVHQIGGASDRVDLIHPHVERLVASETEPASVAVELHRRHAEIRQHAVDRADAPRRRAPRPVAR